MFHKSEHLSTSLFIFNMSTDVESPRVLIKQKIFHLHCNIIVFCYSDKHLDFGVL